jgi:hypothetical protein
LAANGERIGVLSSEGRKVLAIARGCYRDHADIDLWLAGHGGDHIRIDRTNRPSIDLARPCISAVLACQPDALQSLGESAELRESGFLARWLYVVPESHAGAYPRESVTGPVRAVYERCIRGLLELAPGAYSDGTPAPQLVRLTPDAFDFWTKYHDAIRREMCALAESGPKGYVQWLGKLPEHVARLALLFHVVRHVSEGAALGTITAEAADAALVAECLKVHARRAFVLLCEDEEAAAARRVWTWLDKGRGRLRELRKSEGLGDVEGVKGRDVQRAGVAGLEDANKAGRVLDRLAERGYLQRCEWRNPAAPSRPHVVYFVRPASATGKVEGKAA